MISKILKALTGRHYRKYLKKVNPLVAAINRYEEEFQRLSDEELKGKTEEFKRRHREGESLKDLLPEAFAAVKNAARRLVGRTVTVCDHEIIWDMVHFDVQLIGGIALNDRHIAEMATGEGKTLAATLPLYLNALTGKNCQLVTVNDYLARRDSEWMGYIYRFLGLSVGCIQNSMDPVARREIYGYDITYGTASEFGFDCLRDNGMATRIEDQVQRDHYYCIIDEVDSILVDEARTPLIISGPVQVDREMPFQELKPSISRLVRQQSVLCNQLILEAKKELNGGGGEDFDVFNKLLQVKLGMPKNKQFLRIMEDGGVRKPFDKFELEMGSDFNKEQFFSLKEELFFLIDEKGHQADLTEKGRRFLRPDDEDAFVLPDLPSIYSEIDGKNDLEPEERDRKKSDEQKRFEKLSEDIHGISQLLRAYSLYERDVEYIVKDGKVMIIDENTGRIMPGRRWSDGLHQAVEAKEGVVIEKESKTYATITIQNYFRMYEKLSGMTGTAETEANEFRDIYNLDVMVIPTNCPMIRDDQDDLIYKTRRDKYNAVINEIKEANERGQPVLVGTVSVEASEVLSRMLKRSNIAHKVLNAKFHAQEAEIVARAGERGGVTIATNMAGRGTDIKLSKGIPELGGLYVIGTERHTSRRIDRQLRGRSGRQGDLGLSRFFISLEDDLLRLFGNAGAMGKLLEKSVGEGEVPLPSWVIENAQKRVEEQNYSARKRLLQYDDVLNKQREVVYSIRNDAIQSKSPKGIVLELVEEELDFRLEESGVFDEKTVSNGALEVFQNWIKTHFPVILKIEDLRERAPEGIKAHALDRIKTAYATKESVEEPEALQALERYVVINSVDKHWQDHLTEMDDLRQSVGLRGYGQKDPLSEYKSEAFLYFEQMMGNIRSDICMNLFRSATNIKAFDNMLAMLSRTARKYGPESVDGSSFIQGSGTDNRQTGEVELPKVTVRREGPKLGRNDPCICGSGRKYKKCCGRRV
ncbi:MAG: Protein translocase subunit SecA [Candidatus Moanabacter tarae]|uniref:Protein translocase subunit SecA n=1 Tax=Candidatus Moanibacter tarae TaxID=2200854 RepID=A0A2Z4ABI1_9BACT|nr:MAG: Protein translocase subunit SecA [Candidatus Moanabacter tarae]|tara:strand:+ start:3504 stop:6449 length:2946 start_codon:yes stop_codon:yes gene_type:complete